MRSIRFPAGLLNILDDIIEFGCGDDPRIDLIKRKYLPVGKTFAEPVFPDLYQVPISPEYEGDLDLLEDLKKTNKGEVNAEPYPVDQKIEELQKHEPGVKIHEYSYCEDTPPTTVDVMDVVMEQSDRIEKRLVRLENILASTMRYVYRTGSRMQINCVYYGGQESLEKYTTIRCLHDNRTDDGQLVSLDQCLNCSRYEPVYGRVYNILNQEGVNLEQVLDSMQMSYQPAEDRGVFTRTDKMHEEKEMGDSLLEKEPADSFKNKFKMDWSPKPIEG